jgi:hypothetical protein
VPTIKQNSENEKWAIAKNYVDNKNYDAASVLLTELLNSKENHPFTDSIAPMLNDVIAIMKDDSLKRREDLLVAQKKYASMLIVKSDEFKKVQFLHHKTTNKKSINTQIYLYLGRDGTLICPRLYVQYGADDWLFIKKFIFKADDQTKEVFPEYSDIKSDYSGDQIWEWYDTLPGTDMLWFLGLMAKAEKAMIRFKGTQYYDDYTLSKKEQKALQEMLEAYEYALSHPDALPK